MIWGVWPDSKDIKEFKKVGMLDIRLSYVSDSETDDYVYTFTDKDTGKLGLGSKKELLNDYRKRLGKYGELLYGDDEEIV